MLDFLVKKNSKTISMTKARTKSNKNIKNLITLSRPELKNMLIIAVRMEEENNETTRLKKTYIVSRFFSLFNKAFLS